MANDDAMEVASIGTVKIKLNDGSLKTQMRCVLTTLKNNLISTILLLLILQDSQVGFERFGGQITWSSKP